MEPTLIGLCLWGARIDVSPLQFVPEAMAGIHSSVVHQHIQLPDLALLPCSI
jgi:hypothetical protein